MDAKRRNARLGYETEGEALKYLQEMPKRSARRR